MQVPIEFMYFIGGVFSVMVAWIAGVNHGMDKAANTLRPQTRRDHEY